MSPNLPRAIQELAYEEAAQAYLRSLPPEHFMEATAQANQRKITLVSMEVLRIYLPDLNIFNELLVQYPEPGRRKLVQVVPDNMVSLTKERIRATTSYNVPLEPVPPFWVMEYVSKSNKRKDYEDSFKKYERGLKVPYYLIFYPDNQELTLFHHNRRRYVAVKPNEQGRYPIPELDLEVGLLDGWVRFWYQGKLLPLTADLQRELDAARQQAEIARQQAEASRQQAEASRQQAEANRQQAEAARQQAEASRQQAQAEKRRADELQQRLEAAERELAQVRSREEPR